MSDLSRSFTARAREWTRSREAWIELAPLGFFLLLIWAKTSYFNLPPREISDLDWNGWRLKEAVQAWCANLATLLLLLAPLLFLRRIPRYLVLSGLNLAFSALVFADVLHFRYYGDVVSVLAVSTAGQVGYVLHSVLALIRPVDVLLFADVALALVAFRWYVAATRRYPPMESRLLRRLGARMATAAVVLVLTVPVRIVALDRGDTFHYDLVRFFGVRKIGLLNYHLYEAGKHSFNTLRRYGISDEEAARALGYVEQWRPTATAPSALFGAARGKSLIVVVVESLQQFPVHLRIEGQEVTPNLNRLARRSMVFRNVYGQTWEGTSADGEFTTLQSLHPLAAGAVQTRFPGNNYRGLPRILAERGYTTLSSSAYYGDLWRSRDVHPRLGFQRSVFLESFRPGEKINGALADREFVRQILPEVEKLPRPFMALLMTMSTHHPYPLPERHRVLRLGKLEGTTLGDYLHAVRYFDSALGDLLGRLESNGLLDESVLVVYGDHKADLGDPADLASLLSQHSGYPALALSDARLWRVRNQIPLIVHLPDDAHAGERHLSGGQIDVAPTLLNLLGIDDHTMLTLGRDLTQGHDSFVVMRDGSFVLGDTVCLAPGSGDPERRCHDMRTGGSLDADRFSAGFDDALERLQISDLIVRGDLVPPR